MEATLIVTGNEGAKDFFPLVLEALNKKVRGKNEETIEFRLDTFCLEVAMELNGTYDRIGDTLVFSFGRAQQIRTERLIKITSRSL